MPTYDNPEFEARRAKIDAAIAMVINIGAILKVADDDIDREVKKFQNPEKFSDKNGLLP